MMLSWLFHLWLLEFRCQLFVRESYMEHVVLDAIRPPALVARLLVGVIVAVAVAGCARNPGVGAGADSPAHARKVIVDKVDAAVQALRDLAATTQEGKEMTLRKQAALDADEVDIDYAGKPQPLLESMAHRYGYRYLEAGKRAELKTINLRVNRARVIEVLRDVGLQIDNGADLVLDKDAKVIRLIYKKG
jgi:defect-in-organelle-trafficking protein DotD